MYPLRDANRSQFGEEKPLEKQPEVTKTLPVSHFSHETKKNERAPEFGYH